MANTELMKRNISYQGLQIWNIINSDIKNKKSFLRFTAALLKNLLREGVPLVGDFAWLEM